MSVTSANRDISELTVTTQNACRLLFQECYKAGITDIFITEGYRSQARQNYLYEQGRSRKGPIVTWTKNSRHTSRRAWDIAVSPPKSLYDVSTLNRVGAIAKKLGITWGGSWTGTIDRPHFEISTNWKFPSGYRLEGTVLIPTSSNQKVQLSQNGGNTLSQKPSAWSKKSWEKATKAGVVDGTNPKGNVTREQLAVILDRLGMIK